MHCVGPAWVLIVDMYLVLGPWVLMLKEPFGSELQTACCHGLHQHGCMPLIHWSCSLGAGHQHALGFMDSLIKLRFHLGSLVLVAQTSTLPRRASLYLLLSK